MEDHDDRNGAVVSGPRAYLIGVPGAGKTTLMRAIAGDVTYVELKRPLAHRIYASDVGQVIAMQVGGSHPEFGGTDRLSMSVQPAAIALVRAFSETYPDAAIVAEGDRLATQGFLDAFGGDLVWLDTPAELAAARRAGRNLGKRADQNASWVQGRGTKVANLVTHRPHIRLDGALPPVELRAQAVRLVAAFRQLAAGAPRWMT